MWKAFISPTETKVYIRLRKVLSVGPSPTPFAEAASGERRAARDKLGRSGSPRGRDGCDVGGTAERGLKAGRV